MTIIRWAAALALLLSPLSALAQTSAPSVQAPAGYAPVQAPCVQQVDGSCIAVSATSPLPVASTSGTGTNAGQVQGNVAAGATDSGNPVKVGCVFLTAFPTYTAGQRGDCVITSSGFVLTALGNSSGSIAGIGTPSDGQAGSNGLVTRGQNQVWNGSGWDRAAGNTTGQFVVGKGGASLATGQVSVGTSATLIAAARTGRQKIGVTVTTAVQCAFGNPGVTLSTGWPLAAVAYASDSWDTAAALYAVCASAATTIAFREQY